MLSDVPGGVKDEDTAGNLFILPVGDEKRLNISRLTIFASLRQMLTKRRRVNKVYVSKLEHTEKTKGFIFFRFDTQPSEQPVQKIRFNFTDEVKEHAQVNAG